MTIEQFTAYLKYQIKTEPDDEKKKAYQSVHAFLFECGGTKGSLRAFLSTGIERTSQKARHTHDETRDALYAQIQAYLHLRAVLNGEISVSLPPSVPDGQLSLWPETSTPDSQ